MTCPHCHNSIERGARFCGVCGYRVEASSELPQAPPPRVKETAPRGGAPSRPATPIPPARAPSQEPAAKGTRSATSREKPRAPAGDQKASTKANTKANQKANTKPSQKLSEIAIVPAEPGEDAYIGTTLNGRFAIEKKLGEGGFGAVYNGTQLQTGRKVAVKLLHPEMTRDQNVVARFRREGQVLCSLRDAHTITTYDFDQTADGTLFIAMELLEGRSLHDVFHDEAPIAWQRMLKIMGEMCSSLEEAHTLGIVHRDLKPENIYLENRPGNPEFVKILDFGIAKVMRGDGSSGIAGDMSPQLTATGQTLGTLEYMSPEQLMGKPLDGRSDIYGLGVVAFEMLTARLPFPDAVGPAALISAQLKKTPPTPSKINQVGDIPPQVDQLILKMLAKDKNQRYRDVAELRLDIEDILSTSARPPSVRPASAPPEGGSRTPSRAQSPAPSRGGNDRQARSSWVVPSRPPPASGAGPVYSSAAGQSAAQPPAQPAAQQPVQAQAQRPRPASQEPSPSHASRQPAPMAATIEPGSPLTTTARSAPPPPAATRGPMQVVGAGVVSPGHTDPPWAGRPGALRPAGSAVSPGRPRASGGPASAVEHSHEPALPPRAAAGQTPWMWITVAMILFLAIVIGGILALR